MSPSAIIVSLLVFAFVLFLIAELRHISRETAIGQLVLIYLENATPMTLTDLIGYCEASDIFIRPVRLLVVMAKLEDRGLVQWYDKMYRIGDIIQPYKVRYYSLTNKKTGTPEASPSCDNLEGI